MTIYQSVIKGLQEAIDHEEGRIRAKTYTFDIKPMSDYDQVYLPSNNALGFADERKEGEPSVKKNKGNMQVLR